MPQLSCEPLEQDLLLMLLLQSRASHLRLRKKGVIFSQGDPSDALFYVESGTIKLTVLSEHGKEAVIRICGEGSFFGYGCLATQPAPRHYNAVVLNKSDLLVIPRDSVLNNLRSSPRVLDCLVSLLLDRIVSLESELASTLIDTKEQRLARVLLSLARSPNEANPELIAGINQQTLAEMIGSTRQRVNVLLQRFRRMGLIEIAGSRSYGQFRPQRATMPSMSQVQPRAARRSK